MKILIIGGGNMGSTYARSLLNTHFVNKENLTILEKSPEKAQQLSPDIGKVTGQAGPYIKEADLIILAVKPQDSKVLFGTIRPFVDEQQVILSIMAGIKIEYISKGCGTRKVIRAMPNLPAQVGLGMTVFTSSQEVTRIELVMVQNLINSTGKTLYVQSEELIDAATAISGSGPAYVFFFINSLIQSGINLGFSQSEAELLAYETFKGTVDLFNQHDHTCTEWIRKVSSRGGTTEAAFKALEHNHVEQHLLEAYNSAFNRASALSKSE